jgi:predicted RNase H-like HicB family nuclease
MVLSSYNEMKRILMGKLKLTLIFYPQADGSYTVLCPEIRKTTCGDTIDEAKTMIKDLIDDYFENLSDVDFNKEDLILAYNTGEKLLTEITV